ERYHIPGLLEVNGALNIAYLEQSINALVARHESLRTTFKKDSEGIAYQDIASSLVLTIEQANYSKLKPEEKSKAIQAHSDKFIKAPFNLSEGPLLRVLLLTTGKDKYVLGLCMHH
ncbi:condensation domain-containing protein, partial [Pontimicrobium sp. MEBiC06410]